MKLTVFYDGQFWVGVFEEVVNSKLRAHKYIFGSEPKDEEILDLVKRDMTDIINRSTQFVETKKTAVRKINPKRLARLASKELNRTGVSTQAQLALQLEREKNKKEKEVFTRQHKEELQQKKLAIKKQKSKEKHRGR